MLVLVLVAVGHAQPREVTLRLPSHQHSRALEYEEAATRASAILSEWLGAFPEKQLTLEAVPWWVTPAAEGWPTIQVPTRWIAFRGDRSLQRSIIAGLTREHWLREIRFDPSDYWLAGALIRYTAVRMAGRMLEGDHYMTPSFFGGGITVPVRHAPLASDPWEGKPPPVTFDELEAVLEGVDGASHGRSLRAARALQTLERYIGSPTLDAGVRAFVLEARNSDRPVGVAMFTTAVERLAGRELSWFFEPAFRETARYDYGLDPIETSAATDGRHSSRVVVRRFGDAMFTGTSRAPVGDFEEGRALEILVRFADGTTAFEYWDGRSDRRVFEYESATPVIEATVDPRAVLLLDAHWGNNRRSITPVTRTPARQWALLWMAWLQQIMLTTTAFV
jgi:hypothetical protein